VARTLLEIVKSPENIPAMTTEELAHALLEDTQQRLHDRIRGMANRNSVGESAQNGGSFRKRAIAVFGGKPRRPVGSG
jgi:hypothetical protein